MYLPTVHSTHGNESPSEISVSRFQKPTLSALYYILNKFVLRETDIIFIINIVK